MTTSETLMALFFVSEAPIGRRLPDKRDRKGDVIVGPWRDTRRNEGQAETNYRAISPDMIERHLTNCLLQNGERAMLMPYLVDADGFAVATAIDLDSKEGGHAALPQHFDTRADARRAVVTLHRAACEVGLKLWPETTKGGSSRGWLFHGRVPASDARDLGRLLLTRAGLSPAIEVFPKQAYASITGNGVFLPYWGGAAEGRQVVTDPDTGEALTAGDFARLAWESRTPADRLTAIVAGARASGEITATKAPAPRREAADADGEGGNLVPALWAMQLGKCAFLRGLVERAESGGELSYDEWALYLPTNLKPYGEWGRKEYHRLSKFDKRYDEIENDHKWDSLTGGPSRCGTMCEKDPQTDCGLPPGKVSSSHWAYRGMALQMAGRGPENIAEAAQRGAEAAGETPRPQGEDVSHIPEPAGKNEKGLREYVPYQIASILGLDTQAPDTDAALAFRAVRDFKEDLRYCKELGWLHWDGKRWMRDDRDGSRTAALFVRLSTAVREEAARLFSYVTPLIRAGRTEDGEALSRSARLHLKHIKTVESEPFAQRAMILARSPLSAEASLFDPRPWVLGFKNGVWDKGTWREHRREDFLLELCPVEVQMQNGAGEEWGPVLNRITGEDNDYAQTLQDVAGYALSGASHLRLLPWAYGPRGTGKSTIAELLMGVLGNCGASVDSKLLAADTPRERLGANLWGKRLVVCAEAGNQKIDAELLKTLSGGDSYPVRFHYQEAFTAKPTHVLLMTANDAPNMNAYDDALRDRIVTLPCIHRLSEPFPLRFAEGARIEAVRQNPDSALVREFAAWAVEGLRRVHHAQEVHRAGRVLVATAKFWRDTDTLTDFWETMEEARLRIGVTRGELRRIYLAWCETEGIKKPMVPQVWTQACLASGLKETRIGNARGWRLNGDWQFMYTSYTSSPDSDKTSHEEKLTREGLSENTPRSVRSVRNEPEDEDWEVI